MGGQGRDVAGAACLMAYASPQDMIERFGEAEVKQLAPLLPMAAPGYDAVRLNQVLSDASAEMDSHLAIRFAVPLTEVPELVKKFTCDLAREALDRQGREAVLAAGKRARTWVRDVAVGRATLGSGPEGSPEAVPVAQSGGAEVLAPERVFTDDTLAAFLR